LSFYRFRGNREGGIGENASYYVFTHASDGAIEAFPLQEWYKFQPIQRYKSLSAEEAEEQFGRLVLLASFLFDRVCKAGSSPAFSLLPHFLVFVPCQLFPLVVICSGTWLNPVTLPAVGLCAVYCSLNVCPSILLLSIHLTWPDHSKSFFLTNFEFHHLL